MSVLYLNLFQYYYYIIKNNSITKLLSTNVLHRDPVKRILILSYFYSMTYQYDKIIYQTPQYKGYKLIQSMEDNYTLAILEDKIVMIDFDIMNMTISELKKSLDIFPFTYTITKSRGGYHVFITNMYFDFKSIRTLRVITSFHGADPVYSFFTYMTGQTNIRMCRKQSEDHKKTVYEFIEHYRTKKAIDKNIYPKSKIEQVIDNLMKETSRFSDILVKDKGNSQSIKISRNFENLENQKMSLLDKRLLYAEMNSDNEVITLSNHFIHVSDQ